MNLVKFNRRSPGIPFGGLFDEFFNHDLVNHDGWSQKPAVNIIEHKNGHTLEVAAPGLKKEDFNVMVENQILTVSLEKKNDEIEEKKNYRRREFRHLSFKRDFQLPDNVDQKAIAASYNDGILSIELPIDKVAEKEKTKKIEIG